MLSKFIGVLSVFVLSFSIQAKEVKYPNFGGLEDASLGFAVLKLALDKSGEDLWAELDPRRANPARVINMLESGEVDIIDGGYLPSLTNKFDLLYLPIDMGLSGWRVFITHKDNIQALNKVKTLEDLKAFTLGQGQGWYDVDILEHAGLHVTTTPKLVNLINMVEGKRFDLLPLSATSVYQFTKLFGHDPEDLVVNNTVTLVYPFGRFFYIRKNEPQLKAAVERGMNKALEDGSLLELLKSHPFAKDAFNKAKLNERTKISIETPNLSEEFQAIDEKWWYHP